MFLSGTVFVITATGVLSFFSFDSDCWCMKPKTKPMIIRVKAINKAIKLLDLDLDFIKLQSPVDGEVVYQRIWKNSEDS